MYGLTSYQLLILCKAGQMCYKCCKLEIYFLSKAIWSPSRNLQGYPCLSEMDTAGFKNRKSEDVMELYVLTEREDSLNWTHETRGSGNASDEWILSNILDKCFAFCIFRWKIDEGIECANGKLEGVSHHPFCPAFFIKHSHEKKNIFHFNDF